MFYELDGLPVERDAISVNLILSADVEAPVPTGSPLEIISCLRQLQEMEW